MFQHVSVYEQLKSHAQSRAEHVRAADYKQVELIAHRDNQVYTVTKSFNLSREKYFGSS